MSTPTIGDHDSNLPPPHMNTTSVPQAGISSSFKPVRIQVRDFTSGDIAYTLPLTKIESFKDLRTRAHIPLQRNPRIYASHLHLHRTDCGPRLRRKEWKQRNFLQSLEAGETMVIWIHYIRRPGRDRHGYPLVAPENGDSDIHKKKKGNYKDQILRDYKSPLFEPGPPEDYDLRRRRLEIEDPEWSY